MKLAILTRALFFLLLVGAWYSGFWIIAGVMTSVYFFRYVGYEIILLGWCLDIQFMTGVVPWYTIAFAGVFVLAEWLKPRLLAYTT